MHRNQIGRLELRRHHGKPPLRAEHTYAPPVPEAEVGDSKPSRLMAAPRLLPRTRRALSVDESVEYRGTVPPQHSIDLPRLEGWLQEHVDGFHGLHSVEQFSGGQSNPTYKLSATSGAYVLRRKPPGTLLPSAHAVDREFRVLAALSATGVPVARVHALCLDDFVLGSAFYVMDFVEGRIFGTSACPC